MKKVESKKVEALILLLLKVNMTNSCKMTFSVLQDLALIKIDGSMLLKSNSKKLKVILQKDKVKLNFNMILDKLMKELKMPKYLFGTKRRDKF